MPFFISFLIKLLPLYFDILLGYIAGRIIKSNQETIYKLVLYIISPLVIFNGVANTRMDGAILSLPFLTFSISCGLCLLFYYLAKRVWADASKNIIAFTAGSGATGYFGVPLAMIVFDTQAVGVYMMALLGVSMYDNSLGYYMTVRGESSTPTQCLLKVLRLPTLYAFLLGLVINYSGLSLPNFYHEFMTHIKGVYIVLGMMIIGIGLAGLTQFKLDAKFVGMAFCAKFLAWPSVVFFIIACDKAFFNFYNPVIHQVLILLSIVPLATTTVVMASLIKHHPEKTAAAVLLSTLFALIYIPVMIFLFLTDF